MLAPASREPLTFFRSAIWLRMLVAVRVRQRQRQARSPVVVAGAPDRVREAVVVGEERRSPRIPSATTQAPVSVARSTIAAGSYSRSRVVDRVAEHEPALGVGVLDLDRLPGHRT